MNAVAAQAVERGLEGIDQTVGEHLFEDNAGSGLLAGTAGVGALRQREAGVEFGHQLGEVSVLGFEGGTAVEKSIFSDFLVISAITFWNAHANQELS